jgi:hypothetical protein
MLFNNRLFYHPSDELPYIHDDCLSDKTDVQREALAAYPLSFFSRFYLPLPWSWNPSTSIPLKLVAQDKLVLKIKTRHYSQLLEATGGVLPTPCAANTTHRYCIGMKLYLKGICVAPEHETFIINKLIGMGSNTKDTMLFKTNYYVHQSPISIPNGTTNISEKLTAFNKPFWAILWLLRKRTDITDPGDFLNGNKRYTTMVPYKNVQVTSANHQWKKLDYREMYLDILPSNFKGRVVENFGFYPMMQFIDKNYFNSTGAVDPNIITDLKLNIELNAALVGEHTLDVYAVSHSWVKQYVSDSTLGPILRFDTSDKF